MDSGCGSRPQIPPTGLSVIVEPEQPDLDIVFVHGFTGHPERTWSCKKASHGDSESSTEPSSKRKKLSQSLHITVGRKEGGSTPKVFWPRDLLPLNVPTARILTYGYDTHIRHRLDTPALQTTVYDIAWNFLIALEGERRADPARPIIFIVHSLGGIVVKEMLRRSNGCSKAQTHLRQIFDSTRGIVFFGTPHGGADPRGLLHHVAEKLLKVVGFTFNEQVVNALLPSSERLKELRDEFGPLADKQKWFIHSFQEQHGVTGLGGLKVVDDTSSSLNLWSQEIAEHIERTHMEMCRFAESNDAEYKKVTRALGRMTEAIYVVDRQRVGVTSSMNDAHIQMLLESLSFIQLDARQMSIKAAHTKTCRWFLNTSEYKNWLDAGKFTDHNGLLWIKGKPGAGKSTLMKFVTARTRKDMTNAVVVSFFFNARGEELEKSTTGTYRSLLVQLFEQLPKLKCVLGLPRIPMSAITSTFHWSLELLEGLFDDAIQALGDTSIMCFIDALDECEEDQIRAMISFFEHVGSRYTSDGREFRLCFASRHYPHIHTEKGIELVLEGYEGHEQDISSYLSTQLKIGKTKRAEQIRSKVLEKTSGVFMWVVLVVGILNKEFDRGNVHALDRKLQELPKDLHTLFHDILTRNNDNMEGLLLCLEWVLFSAKPLGPTELYFAILSGTSPEAVSPWDAQESTLDDMSRFLLNHSKGLTEITKSKQPRVQFIHESVRDFLLKENGLASICSDLTNRAHAQSYDRLKTCCYNYLNIISPLPPQPVEFPVSVPEFSALDSAVEQWPFLEHATQYLLHYADLAQGSGVNQDAFLASFPPSHWAMYTNVFEKHDVRKYREMHSSSLLYMLAERNAANLCSRLDCVPAYIDITPHRYGPPLFAALATNSQDVVDMFLETELNVKKYRTSLQLLYIEYHHKAIKGRSIFKRSFNFSSRKGIVTHLVDANGGYLLAYLYETGRFADPLNADLLIKASGAGAETVVQGGNMWNCVFVDPRS